LDCVHYDALSLKSLNLYEKVARYKINYTNRPYLKFSLYMNKMMKVMGGTHDYRRILEFNSWGDYYGGNDLILNFIDENTNE